MLLRVVLASDDIRRLVISEILASVDQLKNNLQRKLQLSYEFLIQFKDPEFGNELCNFADITMLPSDRAMLKILKQACEETGLTVISSLANASMQSSPSTSSDDVCHSLHICHPLHKGSMRIYSSGPLLFLFLLSLKM